MPPIKFRCAYRLSDKVIVAGHYKVPANHFNDAEHGTTKQFDGELPAPFAKIYDDTPGSEKLDDNPNFGSSLETTTPETDTDGDGYADIAGDNVATAVVNVQKKDAGGNDMTDASDDDEFFVEVDNGKVNAASGQLVNGAASFTLQASDAIGQVARILVRTKVAGAAESGALLVKFR